MLDEVPKLYVSAVALDKMLLALVNDDYFLAKAMATLSRMFHNFTTTAILLVTPVRQSPEVQSFNFDNKLLNEAKHANNPSPEIFE